MNLKTFMLQSRWDVYLFFLEIHQWWENNWHNIDDLVFCWLLEGMALSLFRLVFLFIYHERNSILKNDILCRLLKWRQCLFHGALTVDAHCRTLEWSEVFVLLSPLSPEIINVCKKYTEKSTTMHCHEKTLAKARMSKSK